jgi:ribosome-associated translation inhibitor RaiA
MRVQLRGKNILELTDDLRDHADRRLRFALGRFGDRIDRVTVRLEDVNGPRGGIDKRCRIEVSLKPGGTVRLQDEGSELYSLIDWAADRVGHAVGRELDRRRSLEVSAGISR